jgi:hypothetical protein
VTAMHPETLLELGKGRQQDLEREAAGTHLARRRHRPAGRRRRPAIHAIEILRRLTSARWVRHHPSGVGKH